MSCDCSTMSRIIKLFVRLNAAALLVIVAWTAYWASTDQMVREQRLGAAPPTTRHIFVQK